jgi:hypothetical protein
LAAALAALAASSALAELTAVGPASTQNGFPLWYQDSNGLALMIGLDGDGQNGLSVYDPVDPNNPFSVQIGFGPEAFYWTADAVIDLPGGGRAILVLALEAAFAVEEPVDGDQFPFARVRVRIDTPVAGTYTVTHPYGTLVFNNVPADDRGINYTSDIGGITPDFARALTGAIGPFLVAVNPPPPVGYVGDPQILQTVTGSPTGRNFFRVEGSPGSDLDGQGNSFVQTNLFAVSGKIFTGEVPTPVFPQRATYTRNLAGQTFIAAFAESAPTALVTLSGPSISPTLMTRNGNQFFAYPNLTPGTPLPGSLLFQAVGVAPQVPASKELPLVDQIEVIRAEFDMATLRLSVEARSGDLFDPPVMVVEDIGQLTANGQLLRKLRVPPPTVTVLSSHGGSVTVPVVIR